METEATDQQHTEVVSEESGKDPATTSGTATKQQKRAKRSKPKTTKDTAAAGGGIPDGGNDGDAVANEKMKEKANKRKRARKQSKKAQKQAPPKSTESGVEEGAEGKMETVEDIVKQSEAQKRQEKDKEKKEGDGKGKKPHPNRYIAFVGNLSYSTTKEDVERYFKCCTFDKVSNRKLGNLVGVRLLTKKGDNSPKGCGFVEFDAPLAFNVPYLLPLPFWLPSNCLSIRSAPFHTTGFPYRFRHSTSHRKLRLGTHAANQSLSCSPLSL